MISYSISRLFRGFGILLGVICLVFFLFQVLPGDPVSMMMGQRADVSSKEAVMREFHLDKPMTEQLGLYLNDLSPLSIHEASKGQQEKYNYSSLFEIGPYVIVLKKPYLRRSFQSNRLVSEVVWASIGSTFVLAIVAMTFATFFGIILGVWAALNHQNWIDHLLIGGTVLGISIPSFVAASLIAFLFAFHLHDWTGLNLTGQLWEIDPFEGKRLSLSNLILPAFTLGIRPLAVVVQLTRSAMLEVMGQDYIRTARAKGLSEKKVLFKHALRNAMNPVLTAVSGWLASLMAGAFFIEYIFDWKGLGSVTINAVFALDFPVVMGATIFIAILFVFIVILVDILYAVLDPRVKLS